MNTKTKKSLIEFAEAVQILANATILTIGMTTATDIMDRAERLKQSLNKDETLTEVS